MGGKKSAPQPYYSPYYKQIETFISSPAMNIQPFIDAIGKWRESKIQQTQQFWSDIMNKSLLGLQHAMSSAIGKGITAPYERIYEEKIGSKLEQSIRPIEEAAKNIEQQYSKASQNLGALLKTAGAYTVLPPPSQSDVGQYQQLLPQYQKSYDKSVEFLRNTTSLLKDLGYGDDEIKTYLSPFLSEIRAGISDTASRFGLNVDVGSAEERFLKQLGF
ncbi:MAG: hypothetical protein RMI01_09825 [Thermodesulfovibrio sp.]|nr:hypothetical protein [Thermodesulfovibrio sp.]